MDNSRRNLLVRRNYSCPCTDSSKTSSASDATCCKLATTESYEVALFSSGTRLRARCNSKGRRIRSKRLRGMVVRHNEQNVGAIFTRGFSQSANAEECNQSTPNKWMSHVILLSLYRLLNFIHRVGALRPLDLNVSSLPFNSSTISACSK